jgi:enolase
MPEAARLVVGQGYDLPPSFRKPFEHILTLTSDAACSGVAAAACVSASSLVLADLAVGWRITQLKVGSTTRSERTAKWNRLLALAPRRN